MQFSVLIIWTLERQLIQCEKVVIIIAISVPPKSLQMAVKTSVDVDTLPDGTVQVVEGRTIEFTCHVIGARPAVGIDWYLDGQLLAPELYNQVEEVSQNDGESS